MVERYIRDVEVAGSNPVASIRKLSENIEKSTFSDFFYSFGNSVFSKKDGILWKKRELIKSNVSLLELVAKIGERY